MKDKLQLPTPKIKGKVKVELKNDKGDIIEYHEQENFISSQMDYYWKLLMLGKIGYYRNDTTNGIFSDFISGTYTPDPMYYVVLTDATHVEDPVNEVFRKGSVIGYATTRGTYSGSNVLRGTINSNESEQTATSIKLVYDFPSHAGNGTFQSIYHSPQRTLITDDVNRIGVVVRNFLKLYTPGRAIDCNCFRKYGDYYYGLKRGSSTSTLTKYDKSFDVIDTWDITFSIFSFDIYNNEIYFIKHQTSTNNAIVRVPLANPSATPLAVANAPYKPLYNDILRARDGGWYVMPSDHKLYKYDNSWNLQAISNDTFEYANHNKLVYVNDTLLVDGYVVSEKTLNRGNYLERQIKLVGYADGYFAIGETGGLYKLGGDFFSRARLDKPVTKLEGTTMKITYEYTWDDFM